jgi:hypothetical protein
MSCCGSSGDADPEKLKQIEKNLEEAKKAQKKTISILLLGMECDITWPYYPLKASQVQLKLESPQS